MSIGNHVLREFKRDDAMHIVALLNASRIDPRALVDGAGKIRLIRYVSSSSSKAIVEDSQGRIIGYAYVADKENNFVFETGGGVHPGYVNKGVGRMLVRWAEDEAHRLSEQAPVGVRCVLQVNIFKSDSEIIELFEAEGFAKVRTWAHYEIHFKDPPASHSAEDVAVRPFDLDSDADWDLVSPIQDAAFMDHWGAYSLPPREEAKSDAAESDQEEIALDFSYSNAQGYCFIALIGEEVAGGILCNAKLVEFQNTGRVGSIFTNPKFRRRGVGRSLMLTAFNAFYQSRVRRVILDTDSESFTDSSRFYNSLGMKTYRREFLYEKEIRPGAEIRKLDREL